MNTLAQCMIDSQAGGYPTAACRRGLWVVCAILAGLLLAGCGGAPASSPPAGAAASVSAPIAASAGDAPTGVVSTGVTPPPAPPTVAQEASATQASAGPTPGPGAAGAGCTTVANGLRLRSGPGEVFDPPIATLSPGTALRPLAYSPKGYPNGEWIAVQALPTGQIGWVNAAAAFITCTVELASLPPGSAPPTPSARPAAPTTGNQPQPTAQPTAIRVQPSPTPPRLAARPPDGEVQVNIVDPQDGDTITTQLIFEAEAVRVGLPKNENGTGIDHVDLSILDAKGQTVYKRTENTARYCAFGGGEPNCTVWVFAAHGNKWPNGKTILPGAYTLRAVGYSVYPKYDKPKKAEIEVQINPAP